MSAAALPDGFAATMHALAPRDARRIRADWLGGGSAARITRAESEQLHELMAAASTRTPDGVDVAALHRCSRRWLREQWAWEKAQKKARKKAANPKR